MADASAQKTTEGGEDPSMEEILQSIRSIIAEEGDGGQPGQPKPNNPTGEVQGSEVLELTDMMEDATPVNNTPAAPVAAAPAVPVVEKPAEAMMAASAAPADVLTQIEDALSVPSVAAVTPSTTVAAAQPTGEALLSAQATASAAAAIKKLQAATEPPIPAMATTPSPVFQSGNTVEAMVAAMLRPMIKEWLDANLPKIVEHIVTLEVRRLSK